MEWGQVESGRDVDLEEVLMRTTLEIDDDVLEAARSVGMAEDKSVGKALSDLARLGLESRNRSRFPEFAVALDSPAITLEMVKGALNED